MSQYIGDSTKIMKDCKKYVTTSAIIGSVYLKDIKMYEIENS